MKNMKHIISTLVLTLPLAMAAQTPILVKTFPNPTPNTADFFGRIEVGDLFDVSPPAQSRLLSTDVAHFGRVLITDNTILNGTIQCSAAGDAWLDPTTIVLPGSAVTGCDHSKLP